MDVVRLRISRCQSAFQPRRLGESESRPHSSQPNGSSGVRQRPNTSLPARRSGNFVDLRDQGVPKHDYLMSGISIQPRDTPKSASSSRPKTGNREYTRPDMTSQNKQPISVSRAPSRRGSGRVSANEQTRSHETPNLGPGHLPVRVQLDDFDIAKPDSFESWLRAFERKRLRTFTAILREEDKLLELLTNAVAVKGVEFKKISLGSLVIHTYFEDSDAFDNFKEKHKCGKLAESLNNVLVTDDLLQEVGVDGIDLSAHVHATDLRRCQQELNVKKNAQRKSSAGTVKSGTEIDTSATSRLLAKSQCANKFTLIQTSFEKSVEELRLRYGKFEKKFEKFLMVLKLTKPVDIEQYGCLDDVIKCFQFLQDSESIGRNVRTDLVREFLSIVNVLRLKVIDVKTAFNNIKGQVMKYTDMNAVEELSELCEHMEGHYETSYMFSDIEDVEAPALGVMDKGLFSGLVCYIPWLLAQTDKLYTTMDNLRRTLTTDTTEEIINVEFRRV